MSLDLPADLHERWLSGQHVGDARPAIEVRVRPGHFVREYADDGHWNAVWTPTDDYIVLPNVAGFDLEQSFDQNGIAVGTFDVDNVAYRDTVGVSGTYRLIERGWFSPLRAYRAPGRPGPKVAPNEWDRLLGIVSEIAVQQGYGDSMIRTYAGLFDATNVRPRPDKIKLSSRDFGQVLVDSKLFGWNIDPKLRDPLTFYPLEKVKTYERSGDAAKRATAKKWRKTGVVIDDVSEMVETVLRWAGFPAAGMRVSATGAPLKEAIAFSYSDTYATVIQKACDLTGYQFFMSGPTDDFVRGRPTFRRSRAAIANPSLVTHIRDDQLLTGLEWNTTDEPKDSIYRVRGKDTPRDRGGRGLGHIRTPAVLSVYRPPWHTAAGHGGGSDRDARILKHAIATEPLYKTQKEVDVAAIMWALASALGATTATLELPANPAIQLDDVLAAREKMAGLNTRCWVAHRSESYTGGKDVKWVQSLGVSCLDDPDVVGVVRDLHARLTGLPSRGLS